MLFALLLLLLLRRWFLCLLDFSWICKLLTEGFSASETSILSLLLLIYLCSAAWISSQFRFPACMGTKSNEIWSNTCRGNLHAPCVETRSKSGDSNLWISCNKPQVSYLGDRKRYVRRRKETVQTRSAPSPVPHKSWNSRVQFLVSGSGVCVLTGR